MSSLAIRAFVICIFLTFFFKTGFAQAPGNDAVANAIPLTSSTVCPATLTSGTVTNGTNSGIAVTTCTGTADDDVWYTFVAQGISTTISVTNMATATGNNPSLTKSGAVIEVFYSSSGNSSTLSSVTCASSANNSNSVSISNYTLTAGATYYVRVFSKGTTNLSSGSFNICITHVAPPPPPSNDNCAGAIGLLSSTTTCTSPPLHTLTSATNSGIAANICGGTPDDDVWFSFTASSPRTSINLSNIATGANSLASAGVGVEVFYSATNNCNALTYISCGSFPSSSTASESLGVFTQYQTGTYYVRVFSLASGAPSGTATFSICITHSAPPANDDCSGATALTLGSTNASGTVWAATASSNIPTGCAMGTPDDDVWYSFVASNATATVSLSSMGSDLSTSGARIQVFSGICSNLSSIACGTTTVDATGLISGNKYYVRVYSNGAASIGSVAANSAFSITVSNTATSLPEVNTVSSRMNEVFKQTTLSPANALNNPWEITYGPDGYLWITESKGYKVYKMNPATGVKTTILDISQGASGYLTAAEHTAFNVQFTQASLSPSPAVTAPSSTACNCWPQGGFAGLALHPKFLDPVAPKNYVYISYVHTFSNMTSGNAGVFFTNSLVRFTYNTTTNKLESPVTICDTLPGSSDHNSQRMIIAPVNGTDYLFYAQGDMGAGQFGNANRMEKAQIIASYEGKILRFNLEPDGDATPPSPTPDFDKWIPNDNPFNATSPAKQSAVWSTGIRNNQGFASININGTDYLYGSSHGPFSDDEINIIQRAKNYGHPIVIGKNDGNYDNASAGANPGSLPIITPSEAANVGIINTNAATLGNGNTYQDPLFSFYPVPKGNSTTPGTIQYIWTQFNPPNNNGANGGWPSEAPSGMDVYKNTVIPGWKNSLVLACLKWGRVMRLKLSSDGLTTMPTNTPADTLSYFNSANRYRDLAFAPNGKDIFLVMDGNGATSGPSALNPSIQACPGCVLKYTFLGYANNTSNNKSTIPISIPVTTGTNNTCNTATTVTIDASNNTLWVPITGPDGNIMAEIKANGNNLGTVTASFYTNSSATIRKDAGGKPYLDRNMTITPQNQPTLGAVDVRLYITNAELNALIGAPGSGVASVANLHIFKNSDACGSTIRQASLDITPTVAEAFGTATNGYVLQASISSFSSFYFGSPGIIPLPLQIVTFKGALQRNDALLQWETANEQNSAYFIVERSTDGTHFEKAGKVDAVGSHNGNYAYTDEGVTLLPTDVLYYRLKSVDKDVKFAYSSIVVLHPQHNLDVMVFPNPVKDQLTIRINNRDVKEVTVQITDMQGRVLYTTKEQLTRSINNLNIDVRRWKQQLYIVKIIDSKAQVLATQKFEKL